MELKFVSLDAPSKWREINGEAFGWAGRWSLEICALMKELIWSARFGVIVYHASYQIAAARSCAMPTDFPVRLSGLSLLPSRPLEADLSKDKSLITAVHPSSTKDRIAGQLYDQLNTGRVAKRTMCGLLTHSSLSVTVDGLPLGLSPIKFWARQQFNSTRIPIEEKESHRWLENIR